MSDGPVTLLITPIERDNMSHLGFVTRQTKVADVTNWINVYAKGNNYVEMAENIYGYYKTKLNGKTKYFKGEMAEMDIERMFRDAGDWDCQL